MTWIRLVLLYFLMVAHKADRQTPSKAFLKSVKTWLRSCWCWIYFTEDSQVKVCSMVLLPTLKPAYSSALIFSACDFNLFSMIFSLT